MSWSTLTPTQWVSFNDIASSGIPLNSGQSHTLTNQWITKVEAVTKYNINPALLSSYTNPQWIVKPIICTSNAVLLSSGCVGCNIVGTYANGSCGTYTATISASDPSCGTWNLEYYCTGCDKYSRERNSCSNATRNDTLVQSNSTYCGGCCGLSTAANYSIHTGTYLCVSCINYEVLQNSNSCYTGGYNYYANGLTYISNPATGVCDAAAHYTSSIGTLCIGCTNYTVHQNVNPCFTGNQYEANGVSYLTNPSTGSCNVSANYSNLIGYFCSSCVNYQVFQNTNGCFTGNQYYSPFGGGTTYASNPASGACNTSPTWTDTGTFYCSGCVNYVVYHNTNPCYGGNQWRSGDIDYSYNPANGGCDFAVHYTSHVGYLCIGCTQYDVYQNVNPCYGGNQYYATNGLTYSTNPSTGTCNYSANYSSLIGTLCSGCINYDVYQNTNGCFTGNQYEANGVTYSSNPSTGACDTTPNWVNH